jgi:hypothetical protein
MSDTPRTDALMPDQVHKRTMYEHILVMESHARQLERELNEAKKMLEALKKLESAQNTLRLIAVADWKTSGELRKMARDAWEKGSNND